MSRMQYGDFVFPHNPRRIELSYAGMLAEQVFPGCGAAMQELGPLCRVARCKGEVFAATPEAAATRLAEIAAACTGGGFATLYLPAGGRFEAVVSRFAYTAQGDGRVLTYALEFIERSAQREEPV